MHSNGFSLVRKIVFDIAGLTATDHVEELDATVGEALLTPTRLYVRSLRTLLQHYRKKQVVHGVAHITGGGLQENLDRILPTGVQAEIDDGSWPAPPIFSWLQQQGDVEDDEMARVFNRGIGLTLVVSEYFADSVMSQLNAIGEQCWRIGRISQS